MSTINRVMNSSAILYLISLISFLHEASGFNLENRLPIVKEHDPETYFGYSVAAHMEGDTSNNSKIWILVGAPLGQNSQPGTNHSGALMKCPITQRTDDCTQVITDGRRYNFDDDGGLMEPAADEEIKDGQWLGVTVRSQGVPGGKVLVCAHRYILKKGESQYGQGLCYVLLNNLEYDEAYEPCKGRPVERAHEDYGFCQVGTSGALLDDDTMVLGAPGPFTWRGTIFVTEIGGEYLVRNKYIYYGDHTEKGSPVDKYSYLGMAVTGGAYFSSDMAYAAGAPRSNGTGVVVIYTKKNPNPIPVQMILEGEQFGSSFGYELATADVNGDRLPDLLVAAPFYFSKAQGGAVYVYQNENNKLPKKPTLKLTGKLESRFGIALANIGDINKDFCDDIAIGAPYEGDGVVYVYLGSPKGLSAEPAQVITASSLGILPKPIKTFGSSLAGGIDLDGNAYPDLVVGAYASSSVIAILARPITNIKIQVRGFELMNVDPNRQGCSFDDATNLTCFSFEACCTIEPFENITSKVLNLSLSIEAETFVTGRKFSRIFFETGDKRTNIVKRSINASAGRQVCTNETAYVKENTRDIQSPIKFRLNYTLVEEPLTSSGLTNLNPILDQTQAAKTFEATFLKDCGVDNLCESQLELGVDADLDKEGDNYTLTLGKSDELQLNVNITNLADSAYESQLFVVHQASVTYIAATKADSVICNMFNETVVSCSLGNPMRRDAFAQISIRFDPRGLGDSETQLSFRIFANTTSKLVGIIPDTKLDVRLIKKAELIVKGSARPEQSFYGGEIKSAAEIKYLEEVGTLVNHTYQIHNKGPWRAPRVVVEIQWPYQLLTENRLTTWLLYLDSVPVVEGAGHGDCKVAEEHVNPLKLIEKTKNKTDVVDTVAQPYTFKMSNKSAAYTYSEKSSFKTTSTSHDATLNRVRREDANVARAEALRNKDGKKVEEVLDCARGNARCVTIRCDLYDMQKNTEAYVHITGRLWNATLVTYYPRVDLVKIVSRASVKIPVEYAVEQLETGDTVAVETKAYPELLDQAKDTSTPIWIYIVSVVCGILVLLLFTWIMWKCGFFKRRRPDPTLSGNLEKHSENKPFIES